MAITCRILGTSTTKILQAVTEDGVDWTADCIGNSGMLDHPADAGGFAAIEDADGPTGLYLCTQDTYDWWQMYIDGQEATQDDIRALRDDLEAAHLPADDILSAEYYNEVGGVDMEDERGQAVELISEIRTAHLLG